MKLIIKILETVIHTTFILIIFALAYNYFYSLFNCVDDDGMFIYGFTLMVITCLSVMSLIFFSIITSIWKKKE